MMFIVSADKYKVFKGSSVTVYGVGFNDSCVVRIGNRNYSPIDYSDEYIVFMAPEEVGHYGFEIRDGLSSSGILSLFVEEYEDAAVTRLPVRQESSFRRILDSLMPRGFGWEYGEGSNWSKLLSGLANAFSWLYGMLRNLVLQMSPVATDSLGTWENELSLPRKGLVQSSDSGRKSEVIRIARKRGGATIPYLKSILKIYGARFDLYEYWKSPSVFPSWVAERGEQANFYLLVKIYRDSYYAKGFNCKSKCNASLGHPRDSVLESILEQEKPAHVKIVYSYVVRILTDMNGNPIVNDNNQMIIV